MHKQPHSQEHARTRARTHTSTHSNINAHQSVYMYNTNRQTHTHTSTHTHTHIHTPSFLPRNHPCIRHSVLCCQVSRRQSTLTRSMSTQPPDAPPRQQAGAAGRSRPCLECRSAAQVVALNLCALPMRTCATYCRDKGIAMICTSFCSALPDPTDSHGNHFIRMQGALLASIPTCRTCVPPPRCSQVCIQRILSHRSLLHSRTLQV